MEQEIRNEKTGVKTLLFLYTWHTLHVHNLSSPGIDQFTVEIYILSYRDYET